MAKNPVPAIPTLHSRSNPLITKQEDVAIYLIRWLFANPGDTSSINEREMISFRKLVATYGDDKNALSAKISEMLTGAMQNYFPKDNIGATCTFEDQDGTGDDGSHLGNYIINVGFTRTDGSAVINRTQITVEKDGSHFDIKFLN